MDDGRLQKHLAGTANAGKHRQHTQKGGDGSEVGGKLNMCCVYLPKVQLQRGGGYPVQCDIASKAEFLLASADLQHSMTAQVINRL